MQIIQTKGKPIKAWIAGVPVEAEARAQLANMASLPFVFSHIAVMPDVHLGKGAAGQAVQNANIALGFPETAGLRLSGVRV